ncbi:hypothetical protein [Cognatiluteimonas weifangensis]|uniref:hypothetical protein n=1 Tax=Cognatiluteimonas weifangensis TaxID=2303539 RepID=UPI0011C1CC28|nr:hypothetical protein [Luteimonas weifangensis]
MHTDTKYLRGLAENENLPTLMRDSLRGAADEIERLEMICVSAHDRLLRGDEDAELLAILEKAWKAKRGPDSNWGVSQGEIATRHDPAPERAHCSSASGVSTQLQPNT